MSTDEVLLVEDSKNIPLLETEVPPASVESQTSNVSPHTNPDEETLISVIDVPPPPSASNEDTSNDSAPFLPTTTYLPTQPTTSSTFTSCPLPAAQEEPAQQGPLPPISSLRGDFHTLKPSPTTDQHPQPSNAGVYPSGDCLSYLPDFSDLCQENYNFWQPFFDGGPASHAANNNNNHQNATSVASGGGGGGGGNLAELDYLLERAGLYQGCDMYRNPWEEPSHDGGTQLLYQNTMDPLSNRNMCPGLHASTQQVMNSSTLPYGVPSYSYTHYPSSLSSAVSSASTYPSNHLRIPSSYGEFLYGQDDPNRLHTVTHSASPQSGGEVGNYVKVLHRLEQPQGIKREADFSLPPAKRTHYPEDLTKKFDDPRFRPELAIPPSRKPSMTQQPSRNMEGSSMVLYAYPVSYPTQPSRGQPVFLQVRGPPEKVTHPPPYGDPANSKTVKELLLQERGYDSRGRPLANPLLHSTAGQSQLSRSARMAMPTYWRLPALHSVHPETPAMTSSPKETVPVQGNIWTVQWPGPSGHSSKPGSVEAALAGFRVKPGSTVTSVYPIPSKVPSPRLNRRPRKEQHVPRYDSLRAALLGESPDTSRTVEQVDLSDIPPFRNGKVDAKMHRPRHFEIERLEIGNFQVDSKHSDLAKSVNKMKILFTKRRFVYEFELPKQKTMCCVLVPFSTVMAINVEENRIRILVNRQPIMHLGARNQRPGVVGVLNVYDTTRPVDITNGDITRTPLHKITLLRSQPNKFTSYLWQFDERFKTLTQLHIPEYVPPKVLLPPEMDSVSYDFYVPPPPQPKMAAHYDSSTSPKRASTRTTRPPRRYGRPAEESAVSSSTSCWVCSCRISCRSVRCSCVKATRKCSTGEGHCQCSNCDNPLNILEEVGVDPVLAIKDECLLQNIYKILYLKTYLERKVHLECCGMVVTVRQCIPGIVPCPNPQCSARLEYSWCRSSVVNTRILSRNHCATCAKCCLRDLRHCLQCKRCFDCGGFRSRCPVCGSDESWPSPSALNGLHSEDPTTCTVKKDNQ